MLDYYKNPEQYLNVLYFSDDPVEAARMHCDKHVSKMLIETAQILSTVWHASALAEEHSTQVVLDWGWHTDATPYRELKHLISTVADNRVYAPKYPAHPSVHWAALYGGNYDWLYRLGMALLDEYTYRFDRIHACTPVLRALEVVPPSLRATLDTWCDAPAIVPSEYLSDDVSECYKSYYRKEKLGPLIYTRRTPPDWAAEISIHKYITE